MHVETLPSPSQLQKQIFLTPSCHEFILSSRETIKNILNRKDRRFLVVLGPCSIHDLESSYEYADRLASLAKKVSETLFLVMRTYFEKPRTSLGWKGFLYDPFLDGSHDIDSGLRLARRLLVDLASKEIPTGSELLDFHSTPYFSDLLTWGCIGARTCTSQPHRQLAASAPFPVGFKNTPDGNINHAIQGILAAHSPHYFLGMNAEGQLARLYAHGNKNCHLVLRGCDRFPNYDSRSVQNVLSKCQSMGIKSSLVIDCSHDNCQKRFERQTHAFENVIEQRINGNDFIVGAMLESHLYEGNQPVAPQPAYGISITDPCLGWQATEALILNAHRSLQCITA